MTKKTLQSQTDFFFKQGLKGTILLRHAHREDIPPKSFGNDIPITMEGHQAAFEWGRGQSTLPFEKIESSPILRCMQTADCIQKGSQRKITINPSPLLGNPGVFIKDPKEAEETFSHFTIMDILKYLVEGNPLKGMHNIASGTHRFLNDLLFKEEQLRLLITHDSIMIPLCCYLFDSMDIRKFAPAFLEPVLIFYDEDHLHCCFRGNEKIIKRKELK